MFEQIARQIQNEYSQLSNVIITQQFNAAIDRLSQTYLVSADGIKKFVAKGHSVTSNMSKLSTEWWALKALSKKAPGIAPKLLFPDQAPKDFVLIEYIEGTNADDALRNGADAEKVFELIGETLAKLHSVQMESFGAPDSPIEDWNVYVQSKMTERFEGACQFMPQPLIKSVKSFINDILPALEQEIGLPPVMIHRDIYPSNVILSPDLSQAIFIDFAMSTAGRPFFDFGKPLRNEPTRPPVAPAAFLRGYGMNEVQISENSTLIQLYVLLELLGQTSFFNRTGRTKDRDIAVNAIAQLAKDQTL